MALFTGLVIGCGRGGGASEDKAAKAAPNSVSVAAPSAGGGGKLEGAALLFTQAHRSGGSFVVTAVRDAVNPPPFPEPPRILVWISRKEFGWEANCNGFFANLRVTSRRLRVTMIGSTAKLCPDVRAREDRWLKKFFESDPYWRVRGARLRLTAGHRVILLRQGDNR
ncbi:MAG TPA: META domain-containing protein [Solirubrobacterales bacterium]|nr:META domain-containing protein [Solirubrobacterales bacterium]